MMIKKALYFISLSVLCMFLIYMIYQWKQLDNFSHQSGLRYGTGILSGMQIEEYYNKLQVNTKDVAQVQVTSWKEEDGQKIYQPHIQKQAKAKVYKVCGNIAQVLPLTMKYGGYTFQEDRDGCVISSGLAWNLFGAQEVVGNMILYNEKEYQVRGVVDSQESILALYQANKEEMMPYVEIGCTDILSVVQIEEIKSSLGIWGEEYIFDGSFYCSVARILISLPFWMIFFMMSRYFFAWCKVYGGKYTNLYKIMGTLLILTCTAIGVRNSIVFTRDFVPTQWSDFSFWSEKCKGIAEGIKRRREFPVIYWEKEVLERVGRVLGAALTSMMLIGTITHMYKQKACRGEIKNP